MAEEAKTKKTAAKPADAKKSTSVRGVTYYLRQAWKKPDKERLRALMIDWRRGPRIVKVDKPLRIDRARALGYKAKKGIIVYRITIERGGRRRTRINKKRRTKNQTVKKVVKMNYKWIAETRVQKRYPNLEVLNAYPIGKDGVHYFYEVIMVDPSKPEIINDKKLNWITKPGNKKRAERGLTSSGNKSRGLRNKGPNLKVRPSLRAWNRKGK